MGLKAVIFDMDGVIVDTEPEYQKTEFNMIRNITDRVSMTDIREFKGIHPILMWTEFKNKYDFPQAVDELYDEEKRIMELYYEKGSLHEIKPIVALIKKVHKSGYKVALASTSEKVNIMHVLKRLNIREFFDAVVSSSDVENGKPHPDVYLLAAKRLGVSPAECAVIEDSVAGVASAKAAGMKVVEFIDYCEAKHSEADITVTELNDITIALLSGLIA